MSAGSIVGAMRRPGMRVASSQVAEPVAAITRATIERISICGSREGAQRCHDSLQHALVNRSPLPAPRLDGRALAEVGIEMLVEDGHDGGVDGYDVDLLVERE